MTVCIPGQANLFFASKEITGAVSSEKHYSKLLGFSE
jgi:hypothetical protein